MDRCCSLRPNDNVEVERIWIPKQFNHRYMQFYKLPDFPVPCRRQCSEGGGQGRLAWLFLLWPPCSLGQMGQSQREVSQAHMVVPAMCLVQAPCVPGGWRGGPGALGAGTWGSPTQSLFQKLLARPWHFPGDFPFPRCLNLQDWVANTLLVICLFDLCCFLIHCCYHSQSRYALEVFALLYD